MPPGFNLLLFYCMLCSQVFGQKAISRDEVIMIGGIKQFIRIKGKDDSKPILLFLHGGPGSSIMHKSDVMTGKLQEEFIVVQWDQRETGQTLKLNHSIQPLTLQLFYNDTHDLIDTLLKNFGRSKLYLVGYSWGSGLGFHIADKYPELLYAYIAVSPVIYQWKSDSISLDILKKMGSKARRELSIVHVPFKNGTELYYHRKWLYKYEGQKFVSLSLKKSFVLGWSSTWFDVWSRSCEVNLFESLPVIHCPVYFFAGENDLNTNASITEEYSKKIIAPKKDLFIFKETGHGLPETQPARFQDIIIEKILPATTPGDDR